MENFLGHTFRGSGCRTTWGVSLGENFLDVPLMEKYKVYSLRRCFKWMLYDAFAVDILRHLLRWHSVLLLCCCCVCVFVCVVVVFCCCLFVFCVFLPGGGHDHNALAEHCQRVPFWRCAHTG